MAYTITQTHGAGNVRMPFKFEDGMASWRKLDKVGSGAAFGVPIDPAGLCTTAHTSSKRKNVPLVFGGGGRFAVHEVIRDAIERIQPGAHQFLPFHFTMGDGRQPEGYFLLNVCSLVDAVDAEKSVMRFDYNAYWRHAIPGVPYDQARLVLKRERIEGLAWWMDKHLSDNLICDELYEVMTRLKVRSMDFWHADEV